MSSESKVVAAPRPADDWRRILRAYRAGAPIGPEVVIEVLVEAVLELEELRADEELRAQNEDFRRSGLVY